MNKDLENKAQKGLDNFELDGGDIDQLMKDLDDDIGNSSKGSNNMLVVVLVAILLLSAVLFYFFGMNDESNADLYAAHFEMPVASFSTIERGANDSKDISIEGSALALGNDAYLKENYQEALKQWEKVSPKTDELRFYMGASYLRTNQLQKANESLSNIQSKEFQDVKLWYLALTALQLDEKETAQKYLSEIISMPKHYKKDVAMTIKDSLE